MGKLCEEIEIDLGKICMACKYYSAYEGNCSKHHFYVKQDEKCEEYKQGDE